MCWMMMGFEREKKAPFMLFDGQSRALKTRHSSALRGLSSATSIRSCRIMFSVRSHCWKESLYRSDLENTEAETLSQDH